MKISNVKPVFKSDELMCFNHYRPVSLLYQNDVQRLHNILDRFQKTLFRTFSSPCFKGQINHGPG